MTIIENPATITVKKFEETLILLCICPDLVYSLYNYLKSAAKAVSFSAEKQYRWIEISDLL